MTTEGAGSLATQDNRGSMGTCVQWVPLLCALVCSPRGSRGPMRGAGEGRQVLGCDHGGLRCLCLRVPTASQVPCSAVAGVVIVYLG